MVDMNKKSINVVWFTGLSGSGKSTPTHEIEKKLYDIRGCSKYLLNGHDKRKGNCL